MTQNIIPLHGDPHRDTLALLPWLVTGQLDAADAGRVAAHLEACAGCRTALEVERRLDRAIVREPATADQGWAAMRQRLDLDFEARRPVAAAPERAATAPRFAWLHWPAGRGLGPALALASVVGVLLLPFQVPARFTALGSAPAPVAGNVVVIFRPDTSEASFRQTLRGNGARLVDGPTAANAYVLRVAPADRSATVDRLRRQPQVVLAEPVDAGSPP